MSQLFDKAVLVVAHPDDEVLWFSSVLEQVDMVVICYLNSLGNPDLGNARRASLREHIHRNIWCPELDESGSFEKEFYDDKIVTEYGIDVNGSLERRRRYRENFVSLVDTLRTKLNRYTDIITHNPWGEYGHPEHIQVYAAIKYLTKDTSHNTWFTNYCSDRSARLMARLLSNHRWEYVSIKTNVVAAREMMAVYRKNGCSTWYEDWRWFEEESLIRESRDILTAPESAQPLPVNCILMPPFKPKRRSWRSRIVDPLLRQKTGR